MTVAEYLRPAVRGVVRKRCARCRRQSWRWRLWQSEITGLWYCDADSDDPWNWGVSDECSRLWAERLRADARKELVPYTKPDWDLRRIYRG